MKALECPNCGAPLARASCRCDYCGTEFELELAAAGADKRRGLPSYDSWLGYASPGVSTAGGEGGTGGSSRWNCVPSSGCGGTARLYGYDRCVLEIEE